MIEIPLYSQLDPRWRDVKLGYSSLTIGSHGCVICCLAMMLHAAGVPVTPPEVNEEMRKTRAFVPGSGRAIWSRITIAFPAICCPKQQWYSSPRVRKVEVTDLPVLVELLLPTGPHWVLGIDWRGYLLVHDPLQPPERQRADNLRTFYPRARITRSVTFERTK